ncbi:MAG: ABC-F family ATP-binding cassette domain-containing protein [bacterium]|nr:ABC-F family ATP-binding cassette domain-containing protein [bacterium]
MLTVRNLEKTYGALTVLGGVSFSLAPGQKAALVGLNGIGKTTLLRILAGEETFETGEVELARDTCIGYLPQDTSLAGDETIAEYLRRITGITVLEEELDALAGSLTVPAKWKRYEEVSELFEHLDGYSFERNIEIMLEGFGLGSIGTDHRLSDLSSGQKSKVVLTGILLKGVDLLLLDEPTNNLDLPALVWLEDFLERSAAACIVISHDRRFLDKVVRKIFEIHWQTRILEVRNGTYSDYLAECKRSLERQKQQFRLQQDEIKRLEESARQKRQDALRGASWVGSDNDKFLRGFKRDQAGRSGRGAKAIEKRIEQMEKVERPVERSAFTIPIEADDGHGDRNVVVTDLIVGYADTFKVGPISFGVEYGERVGIMGLNGSGKSTLLKTVTGVLQPLSGTVKIGSNLRVGNLMQEHESLPRNEILFDFLKTRTSLDRPRVYAKLAQFGFDERHVLHPISALSPGGRARLLLALFSVLSVNILVLDEPTNHLDMEALDALEETLETYTGTVLIVSHDRHFLEHASLTHTFLLSEGTFTRIEDYRKYITDAEMRARKLLRLL